MGIPAFSMFSLMFSLMNRKAKIFNPHLESASQDLSLAFRLSPLSAAQGPDRLSLSFWAASRWGKSPLAARARARAMRAASFSPRRARQ